MPTAKKKAVASYRRRMRRKGLVRVEVQVREGDAPLLRSAQRTTWCSPPCCPSVWYQAGEG